jgi:hypothetical protein
MAEIVDEAGVSAAMPMQGLQKLGGYRKVPADAWYGAALTAGKPRTADRAYSLASRWRKKRSRGR